MSLTSSAKWFENLVIKNSRKELRQYYCFMALSENADTKANDTRVQVILSLDQDQGERGKGISSEEQPSVRLTGEITEVCYQ